MDPSDTSPEMLSRDERLKIDKVLELLSLLRVLMVGLSLVVGVGLGLLLVAYDEVFYGLLFVAGGAFIAMIVQATLSWAEQMLLLTAKIARGGRPL